MSAKTDCFPNTDIAWFEECVFMQPYTTSPEPPRFQDLVDAEKQRVAAEEAAYVLTNVCRLVSVDAWRAKESEPQRDTCERQGHANELVNQRVTFQYR